MSHEVVVWFQEKIFVTSDNLQKELDQLQQEGETMGQTDEHAPEPHAANIKVVEMNEKKLTLNIRVSYLNAFYHSPIFIMAVHWKLMHIFIKWADKHAVLCIMVKYSVLIFFIINKKNSDENVEMNRAIISVY